VSTDRRVMAAGALIASCLCTAPAQAYRCSRVTGSDGQSSGPSLSWNTRDVEYAIYYKGTSDIAGDGEFAVLRRSFATWVGVENCDTPAESSDWKFHEKASLSYVDRVGYDYTAPAENENLLIFRDDGWQIPGQESTVIALTTVTYKPLTGEIIDADIEFNSANFHFSADATNSNDMDLMNAAVHEIGHVVGLDHSDQPGSTMEAQGAPGEITKRTLKCDDRDALVFKYPQGGPNGYCTPVASCGFCAPPDKLASVPQVTLSKPGSGGCRSVDNPLPWVASLLAGLAAALRRRPWVAAGRRR
jgi:hypothetical protein